MSRGHKNIVRGIDDLFESLNFTEIVAPSVESVAIKFDGACRHAQLGDRIEQCTRCDGCVESQMCFGRTFDTVVPPRSVLLWLTHRQQSQPGRQPGRPQ